MSLNNVQDAEIKFCVYYMQIVAAFLKKKDQTKQESEYKNNIITSSALKNLRASSYSS